MGVSTQSTWELRFDRPTAMVGYLFLLLIVGVTVGVEGSKIVAEVNEDGVEAYIPDKDVTTTCDIFMKYTVKDGDDGDKEWSQSRIQKKKSKAYCKHTKVNFKTPVVLEFDVGDNKLMRVELTGKERKKNKGRKFTVTFTDKPVDPNAPPTDPPTEEPENPDAYDETDAPNDVPTAPPTDDPTDSPNDDPTAPPDDLPTDPPTNDPENPDADDETDAPDDDPTVPPTDDPTDVPIDDPTDPPLDAGQDPPTDEPTDPPTDLPTDPPTVEPENPDADVETDTPEDDPTAPPVDDPTDPPEDEPTAPPTDLPSGPRWHCRCKQCDVSGTRSLLSSVNQRTKVKDRKTGQLQNSQNLNNLMEMLETLVPKEDLTESLLSQKTSESLGRMVKQIVRNSVGEDGGMEMDCVCTEDPDRDYCI